MSFSANARRSGFTLIELSIVLVIIGLIVGSILAGQSMQRQSQINAAMMDSQRYIAAAQGFQQKYNALPGDFAGATALWGTMTGGGTPCTGASPGSAQSGTQTCNGDGNGQVVDLATSSSGAPNTFTSSSLYESFWFWQHLANAQMIQGSYTGIPGAAGSYDHVIGTNCPKTRMDNAGFGVAYQGVVTGGQGDTNFPPANYGHIFVFGGYKSNSYPAAPAMSAQEAAAIDSKYDDGLPATGNILTWVSGSYDGTKCITGSAYNTTTGGLQCSLIIITGF